MAVIFEPCTIEKLIGYTFGDKLLLRKSFVHASYSNEHRTEESNEVLEFFGDAIIEFIVTEYLYKERYANEGDLTVLRTTYISNENLLIAVKELGIGEYMLMGAGAKTEAKGTEKLFASLYEALTASIYLDGGIVPAKKFVLNTLIKVINSKRVTDLKKKKKEDLNGDGKSKLQEYVQKTKMGSLFYETLSKSGPDHSPIYKVAVILNGQKIAEGTGSSKKLAEMNAASKALKKLEGKKSTKKAQVKDGRSKTVKVKKSKRNQK